MGLKWQSSFTSNLGLSCSLLIYAKDYSGTAIDITLAGTPVIQTWEKDDAQAPIKGCSLDINIVSDGTSLSIADFTSDEDDFFKVEFKVGGSMKFTGYLVQDDYSELIVDFTHEINLKATDNLGLLKNVTLLDCAIKNGEQTTTTYTIEQIDPSQIRINGVHVTTLKNGQYITIGGGTVLDGTYELKTWWLTSVLGIDRTYIVFETNLDGTLVGTTSADITIVDPVNLDDKIKVSDLLHLCIKNANLSLKYRIYGDLQADDAPNARLLDNLYLQPTTFKNSKDFESCYSVVEKILSRFKFTLFQAEGFWNIMRWDELKISNTVSFRTYDADFVYESASTIGAEYEFGFEEESYPEAGLSYSLDRPLAVVKETFNYKNPSNLIHNINFYEIGQLISTTVSGDKTIYDYDAAGWAAGEWWTSGGNGVVTGTAQRLIRVIKDSEDNEVERYLVAKGGGNGTLIQIESNRVEVREGDKINFSYDVRCDSSGEKYGWRYFYTLLLTHNTFVPNAADDSIVKDDGSWGTALPAAGLIGYNYPSAAGGSGWRDWTTISKETLVVPHDGVIILKLVHVHLAPGSTGETHYKNINFEVIRSIDGNGKVIGHEHKNHRILNLNNSEEKEIYVDETTSNAIGGTFFLESMTGPLRDLAKAWIYNGDTFDNLGKITTLERMFLRSVSRRKLEGSIYNLTANSLFLSMLSVMKYALYPDLRFVWGKFTIDYKRDKASGTLFEILNTTEDFDTFVSIYSFRYLTNK